VAWSRVQSKSTFAASGTSLGVAYGSALTAGTKLIALVMTDGTTTSGVKDAAGNAFAKVGSVSGTNTADLSLWALDTPAGDAGALPVITATFAGASNGCALVIQEVSGLLAGGTGADGTAGTETISSGNTSSPSYSSTAANEYLVACYGDDGLSQAITWTAPPGYTADPNSVNTQGDANAAISYKNSTGGAESGNYTQSAATNDKEQILVAFKVSNVTTVSGSDAAGAAGDGSEVISLADARRWL
jgi:hypothetical protein